MQRGVAVHWAVIPAEADHANCQHRYEQLVAGHVAAGFNPSPAYNSVRCQHGVRMGGRGWGRLSGANGTTLSNLTLWAVCAMIAPGDLPSPELLAGLRDDIDTALSLSSDGQEIHYHGQIVATQCAGPDLNGWVLVGAPRPFAPFTPGGDDVPYRLTADIPNVAAAGSVWGYSATRWFGPLALTPGVVAQDIDPGSFMDVRREQDQLREFLAAGGVGSSGGSFPTPAALEQIVTAAVEDVIARSGLAVLRP